MRWEVVGGLNAFASWGRTKRCAALRLHTQQLIHTHLLVSPQSTRLDNGKASHELHKLLINRFLSGLFLRFSVKPCGRLCGAVASHSSTYSSRSCHPHAIITRFWFLLLLKLPPFLVSPARMFPLSFFAKGGQQSLVFQHRAGAQVESHILGDRPVSGRGASALPRSGEHLSCKSMCLGEPHDATDQVDDLQRDRLL